jgi:uncharacterized membrane protein YbhN (UPF0104 family)
MKAKLKKIVRSPIFNVLLVVGLTVLVLWLSLRDDGAEILDIVHNANWFMLGAIAALMVFERWIHGWGLARECRLSVKHYTTGQGFINAYTAGLFNNITPSSSGGQFAQVFIFRRQGVPTSDAIGVLWLDFIVYQTTMSLFVLVLLILRFAYFYSKYSQFFIIVIFGFLINSAVIFLLWALATHPRFYRWLTTTGLSIGVKLHLIKDKEKTKSSIDGQLARFDGEIAILRAHKKTIALVALSDLLRLVIYYSVPFMAAIALHIEVTASIYIDTVALASFVAMVNAFLPMPGSSGGTEATFILMFSTIFGRIQATSIMLVWRILTYYFQTIVGAGVYIYAKTRPEIVYDNLLEIPVHPNDSSPSEHV